MYQGYLIECSLPNELDSQLLKEKKYTEREDGMFRKQYKLVSDIEIRRFSVDNKCFLTSSWGMMAKEDKGNKTEDVDDISYI